MDVCVQELLYIYIESGIPIIATLSSKNGHHAVIVIGRENIDNEIKYSKKLNLLSKSNSYPFSKTFEKVLIMNDNKPPFEVVDFDKPFYDSESNSDYHFTSFIVPLYPKVFLEAYQFKNFFFTIINTLKKYEDTKHIEFTKDGEDFIYRFFLTSSNSYKDYIAKSTSLSKKFKTITICKCMPKFIWVAEVVRGNTINSKQKVDSIVVVDATESGLTGHLIFASNSQYLIIKNSGEYNIDNDLIEKEKNYTVFEFEKEIFYTFANNLKGEHTKWQN